MEAKHLLLGKDTLLPTVSSDALNGFQLSGCSKGHCCYVTTCQSRESTGGRSPKVTAQQDAFLHRNTKEPSSHRPFTLGSAQLSLCLTQCCL